MVDITIASNVIADGTPRYMRNPMAHPVPLAKALARYVAVFVAMTVALPLTGFVPLPGKVDVSATSPVLVVDAPKRVAVGEPITLTVSTRNAVDVAGYELALRFDTTVAHLRGLHQRQQDLKKLGRDVQTLGSVELPDGVAFGAYSCSAANCAQPKANRLPGGRGTLRLAKVTLVADQPGPLTIRVDRGVVVDVRGENIPVSGALQTLTVDVAGVAQMPRTPRVRLSPAVRERTPAASIPLDLNGDGRVSHADTMEVVLAWTTAREAGIVCGSLPEASRDVTGDGCIDVADVQRVAGSIIPTTTSGTRSQRAARTGGILRPISFGSSRLRTATVSQAVRPTLYVNSTGDDVDAAPGDGVCATAAGACTLRAAIAEANKQSGANLIAFAIPGTGVHTIALASSLPSISDETGPTTIDGYTQAGAQPNTDPLVSNAQIKVEVVGSELVVNPDGKYVEGEALALFDAIRVTSPNNLIRGLAFYRTARSIWMSGTNSYENSVVGNFVGMTAAGQPWYDQIAQLTKRGGENGAKGVVMNYGAHHNHVGGVTAVERNIISGNANDGIHIQAEGSEYNKVLNNLFGLGPNGRTRVRNWGDGLDVNVCASHNQIGGTAAGQRNVISGNSGDGVEISHETCTTQNSVAGNYIGTDVTGSSATSGVHANTGFAVTLEDGASANTIGPNNVMANNTKGGVQMYGYNDVGNRVFENRIGVGLNGTALPNGSGSYGVLIRYHATDALIGPNNIIANNGVGVMVRDNDNDQSTITQNSMYSNSGLGIDLGPSDVNLNNQYVHSGPNERLNFPVLTSASLTAVAGTACVTCTVEVFVADSGAGAYGEGKRYLQKAVVGSDGRFTVSITGVAVGDVVTATATDATGNTSEFSLNLVVSDGSSPPPTATPGPMTETLQPNGVVGKDTRVAKGAATTNYGTSTSLAASGKDSTQPGYFLLAFDLSGVASTNSCVDVTLTLWNATTFAASADYEVYPLIANSDWTETGATWNTKNGTTTWTGGANGGGVQGVDVTSAPAGTFRYGANAPVDSALTATLDCAVIRSRFGGTLNLLVKRTGTSTSLEPSLRSSDSSSTNKPRLVISHIAK
ncbi:MAG: hypothetical protein AVDCRST_MAG93-7505 [uncultured Chloroflexia bacterium]|uniref:Carbohydrate-binding module family 96 domain-containing protein n=1 Tax=uncultured Chloroflexia bacterium TaxID=1672391 RepID=A0A6J4MID0_9CHLR|nr:MAG: hypothetical protein AVDCRST_MAG93-7505 [uncultured Chloroflexia bacterium]